MITLHPEYLLKRGKKEFVVLSYEEFRSLQEFFSDVNDLLELRKAKKREAHKPTISLQQVKRELEL